MNKELFDRIDKLKAQGTNYIQASNNLKFFAYDVKRKSIKQNRFSFFLSKNVNVEKDTRKFFPSSKEGILVDDEAEALRQNVISNIMNDPARYDRKFNYLIEAMMESIFKSSKHVNAEGLSENKTYIMEKLRDIVGNVSLSIFFKWCNIRTCGNCTYYVN